VASFLVAFPLVAATTGYPGEYPGTVNPAPPGPPSAQGPANVVPGTVNYVEGQVSVAGQPVTPRSAVQMEPNQVLETGQGRAEVLLTPGVFLRVGDNSAVRLVSPRLANTSVEVLRGQAIVEVTELFKDDNISVAMNGASTRLDKQGLYAFNANTQQVQVFDGKATVEQNGRTKELGKEHELALANWKVKHFDAKAQEAQDPLYAWSKLRSEYEAEASMQSAQNVFTAGWPYWYGAGWYWNPYWDMYGFLPGDGIWFSPFGYPFYSPWVVGYYGGFGGYGFGYGRGYYGHGFGGRGFGARGFTGHGHIAGNAIGRGGFGGGHFGGGAFAGGGFRGGMGGGFAGGMHGGFGGGGRR
jgi:hypothetical protein